jgi:hypothetical protein
VEHALPRSVHLRECSHSPAKVGKRVGVSFVVFESLLVHVDGPRQVACAVEVIALHVQAAERACRRSV